MGRYKGFKSSVEALDDNDDHLYEQFLQESAALERDQQRLTQDIQQELRSTLDGIMETIESEVQHNRRQREANENANYQAGTNIHNPNHNPDIARQGPLFVRRRPYLQIFIRNLLLLDYFVVLLLFPFSLYNILRCGFSSVTFSETDFVNDILTYCRYVNDFVSLEGSYRLIDVNMDLLNKFHNIIVYYTWPTARSVILTYGLSDQAQNTILSGYQLLVKSGAVLIYLLYGIGGTVYLTMAGFFFSICLMITLVRRYKNVQRIVAASIESSARIPGVL